jgi:hypothetical protein
MSRPTPRDILELTHGVQQDLAAAQAKLVTIRSWLAQQPDMRREQSAYVCPRCGLDLAGPIRLADHLANVHGEN